MGRTGKKKGRTAPKQIATMRTSAAARKEDTVEDDDSFNSEDPEKEKGKNDPNLTQPVVTPTQTEKQNRIVDGEENGPPDMDVENIYSNSKANLNNNGNEEDEANQKCLLQNNQGGEAEEWFKKQ